MIFIAPMLIHAIVWHNRALIKFTFCYSDLMIKKLRDSAKEISRSYVQSYEDCMTTCMEKCLRMEQRLAFATNRSKLETSAWLFSYMFIHEY